jgi:ABC-type nitrate/sulfonate/bicarbonate transport system permease component
VTAAAMRRSRAPAQLFGAATVLAVVAALEGLIRAGVVNAFVIPLPSQVIAAIPRIVVEEHIPLRFWQTSKEVLWAALLLATVGIGLGVLLYRVRLLRLATETWVGALAAAPIVLLFPLFLVIFGRSATTIVMIGFCAGLAPVILKTVEGLAGTRPVLIDVGRSLKLTRRQQFWKILLPSALPTVFVGMRLGLVFAMINIVGVEYLINFGGLGQLVNDLAERYDLPGTYAAILFVVLASILFFDVTERLERWLRPHR